MDWIATPDWLPLHEHDKKIKDGDFTGSDYLAAFGRVAGLARQVGPHIKVLPIYTDWCFDPRSGRDWRATWPGDDADLLGVDVYRWAANNPPRPNANLFDPFIAAAKSVGKPWALLETGIEIGVPNRSQAITEVARAAAKGKPVVVCYFNVAPRTRTGQNWVLNSDEATAWKAGQAG